MTPPASRNAGLHVRYEKAGLILDALPVPRNADAVIIEANVRLPAKSPRDKHDFTLQWATSDGRFPAEVVLDDRQRKSWRVLFRLPVPESSSLATIRWREHSLGAIETPVIGVKEMVDAVTLDMPTLHASLAGHAVACRAVITGQAKNVLASAVIRSASLLAPLHDWRLRVQIAKDDAEIGVVYVPLTSAEMRQRQTLLTALLPKMRITGSYEISWHLASRCLATQRVRVVSKRVFLRSLRVSAARFHLEAASGARHCVRALPGRDGKLFLDGIRSITPVFYVSSSQAGVAGLAPFTLRALVDGVVTTLAIEKDVLVTDGLRAVALATVPAAKIGQIKHFSLATGDTTLGNLSLAPAPTADFTSEGGFAPLEDFLWSPAAEEQLHERLGKLLDDD